LDTLDVPLTLQIRSEKMKNGAVVPNVDLVLGKIDFEDVTFHPFDSACCFTSQSSPRALQRGSRQVKDSYAAVATREKLIDQ